MEKSRNTDTNSTRLNSTRLKGKRHSSKSSQEYRSKSVPERFQKDSWYRGCQSNNHGWTETCCRYLDFITLIDISHKASYEQRARYEQPLHMKCGESNYQLNRQNGGGTVQRGQIQSKRSSQPTAGKMTDMVGRRLEDALAESNQSSHSTSSSTSWDHRWWSGYSEWDWKDDDWTEDKW